MGNPVAVVNAGSSTVKFSLLNGERRVFDALLDRLGSTSANGACASLRDAQGAPLFQGPIPADNHEDALIWLFDWLARAGDGCKPAAVGHRVVHGGDGLTRPVKVTGEIIEKIEALIPLAPLHQPHNLAPIRLLAAKFPDIPQVACFDTAFHASQSAVERRFALPREYEAAGIRRYGFHGLSYEYVAARLAEIDPCAADGRTIVCHLGNGASLCAMKNGRSVATTMSFTALDGIPMGTRCGAIDPGVLLHLMTQPGMDAATLSDLLYKRSGLLGLSGLSGDMRDLLASDRPEAAEAVEYFCYRIAREIGSLTAALGGLDALVFTAGIGEHAAPVRARICELSTWLGVAIDPAAYPILHTPDSRIHVLVVSTDEEAMIARHVRRTLGLPQGSPRSL
ncbi:acetate/propionate family kinase [Methylococcus capsulatus]|uniref:Acetate kinase n=1 Tax=Methylococcus capsulatus TaxID=414 RepID=A0AA35V6M5_METCP|nr:acetate/propionate family kinase [Methylococcus capsulatus]QXP87734.1 acetate/propionate family kinase [Methylococcus capsulatus]CAI8879037.1 Acetate kinase [Methylococcus capsulatus]